MLTIGDTNGRWGRRDFLRVGSLALTGWLGSAGMPKLSATEVANVLKDRSIIFVFLHGGPSQTETFDPKMTAPAGVRSATGELQTRLPGITFGGTFPKLADRADRITIVRSFMTGDGNHDIKPVVGRDTLGANMGSLYSRIAGPTHPQTGIPRNAALFPRAVDPTTRPTTMNFGKFDATGGLGSAYAPFVPGSGAEMQSDMRLNLSASRLDDRRHLLRQLDQLHRRFDAGLFGASDQLREQAFETILGGVADAFDLENEDPRVVARYDTAPLVRPSQISRAWNNYNNYVDNAKSLGKLLLLARRLCEAGCGFVTVTTNFVWDMHADVNNAGVEEGMRYMGPPLDHALSVLLDDLRDRNLEDKILVVACGEMGRTPKINANGGRDHWGDLAPLLLAGGGLRMGQVIGQSSPDAARPQSEPITIRHLMGTIMHSLLDVGAVRLLRGIPPDVLQVVTSSPVIPGVLS